MVGTFSEIQDEFFGYVGDVVYATMTTVDAKGRPRARILIAVWEMIDGRPVGWLATSKTPVKTAHLEGNPHATFSYWDRRQNAAFADTVAAWVEDPEVKERVWDLYRRGSPPRVGYDPRGYWKGPDDPGFAVLRLDPWRVQVVRGADLRSRIWRAEVRAARSRHFDRVTQKGDVMTDGTGKKDEAGSVRYIDPDGLNKNPAFTNVVVVEGTTRTVYVGGQDSVDASGNIIGKGDIAAQTEQVLANVRTALAAGGAEPEHVIKWNLLLVEGVSLQEGYSAFERAWPDTPHPPAITAAFVAGLAHPDFLVEMDAIAVVPL